MPPASSAGGPVVMAVIREDRTTGVGDSIGIILPQLIGV